jgi:cation diffusion facilitator family transporter
MQWVREEEANPARRRMLRRAIWITLAGNLLLAVGKGVAARLSGSVALYADAANSVSDVIYALMLALGLWIAQQPADLSHPQGHSRFEPLVGLAVAAAMSFAAYEAGRASIARFQAGGTTLELGWPILALVLSAGVKLGMYALIHRIAGRVNSPALDAAAKDNLADVLSSTAAFAGTVGSVILTPLADPIAGALVTLWIVRAALEAWRENLKYLTGGGAPSDLRTRIVEVAESIDGVLNVHQVITEYAGPHLVVDMHINVDGTLTLFKSHAIADEVQATLEALSGVDRAYVHLEPCLVPEDPDCGSGA